MENITPQPPAINPSEAALYLSRDAGTLARRAAKLAETLTNPLDRSEAERAANVFLQGKTLMNRLHGYLEDEKKAG